MLLIVKDQPAAMAPPGPHTRSTFRWIVAGSLLSIAAIAAIFFWSRSGNQPVYVTVPLERGDIESSVSTSGTLNAVTTVQVGSQVSGNILALFADFNTKVKKGDLIAEIDPAPFKAAVDQAVATRNAAKAAEVTAVAALQQARSNLVSAQANVASQKANVVKQQSTIDLARVENDRRQIMVKDGSTSQEDADTSKASYDQALATMDATRESVKAAQAAADAASLGIDVAQHQLDQAKAVSAEDAAALDQANLNLSHTRILAPVDGTVESRNMDVGQTVAASFQAPVIFLIAQDMTQMQVDTNVDESDVGRIKLAQTATFTVDAWPGRTFHGTVTQIREAPINVQNVITYDVVIEVSNADLKLFPGMTANVTVSAGKASNVLKLPKAALRFRARPANAANNAPQTVNVLGPDNQLRQVPVKTGLSDSNFVEVLSGGLKEGDQVVTGMAGRPGRSTAAKNAPAGRMGF